MGLLNFLNKRSANDGKSDRSFSLHRGRPVPKPSVTNVHSSNISSTSSLAAASFSRAQGHVDILDAQCGIRPYDFRSRVDAAGVRDYGEDVADRNLGENGVDVRSAAAQKFYERKANQSAQSPSVSRYGREADQPSFGGSTYGGSEADDVSFNGNWTMKRCLSKTLSLESKKDVVSSSAGRLAASPVSPALHQRRSFQVLPATDGECRPTRSGISRDSTMPRVLADRFVANTGSNNTPRQPAQSTSHAWNRSISPPCVPRYRSQSSLSAKREEEMSRITVSQRGVENRSERAASAAGMLSSRGMARPNISRDETEAPRLQKMCSVEGEADFDFGIPPTSAAACHARPAKPRFLAAAAPVHHHPDWHQAVRRAVDETLAQLPLSVDWKALLEMTQNGLGLDEDVTQMVPLRRSLLWQGSMTNSSSTPTTADFSDYSSSIAGYPGSRHTMATSTDSLIRIDTCPRAGSGDFGHSDTIDVRCPAGDESPSFPTIAIMDEDHGLESTKLSSEEVQYLSGSLVNNIDQAGAASPTSEYSDVDSFAEKRQQQQQQQTLRSEKEGSSIFDHGSFSDLGANLPGLLADTGPGECAICNALFRLNGNSAPRVPCNHNGTMSRKQRLRALGYDYESDESDPGAAKPVPTTKSSKATKRLTFTGGLRRLKLVDDCIEEASEEERTGTHDARRQQALGRKSNVGGQGRTPLPCIVRDVADAE
ncbi:hypothetical protein E4U21_000170 [Claviceps maximensis]|nr:hypothetical protein E4U21_000170 [Claviceps maximensis]